MGTERGGWTGELTFWFRENLLLLRCRGEREIKSEDKVFDFAAG